MLTSWKGGTSSSAHHDSSWRRAAEWRVRSAPSCGSAKPPRGRRGGLWVWHDVDDQNRPRRGGVAPEDAVRAGRAVLGIRLEHLAAVRAQITVPLVRL